MSLGGFLGNKTSGNSPSPPQIPSATTGMINQGHFHMINNPVVVEKGDMESRKELERFIKFFTLKCVQAIVQSRLGSKINSLSRPHSTGADWFNLTMDDNDEILKKTRSALELQNEIPIGLSPRQTPLIVEISLQTKMNEMSGGEFNDASYNLILELWKLDFSAIEEESNARVLYAVYSRLSILLKSLISVTRVLPAYKLSRRLKMDSIFQAQSHQTNPNCTTEEESDYRLYYNIYPYDKFNQFNKDSLGEGFKVVQLGKVVTPRGCVTIDIGYRTKMELVNGSDSLAPVVDGMRHPHGMIQGGNRHPSSKLMIKSDHYGNEDVNKKANKGEMTGMLNNSPKQHQFPLVKKKNSSLTAAFVSSNESINKVDTELIEDIRVPFSSLLTQNMRFQKRLATSTQAILKDATPTNNAVDLESTTIDTITDPNNSSDKSENSNSSCPSTVSGPQDGSFDEFILVENIPFATTDILSDLSSFFKAVKSAPKSLASFDKSAEETSKRNILSTQDIEDFETYAVDFEDFVGKLCSQNTSPISSPTTEIKTCFDNYN